MWNRIPKHYAPGTPVRLFEALQGQKGPPETAILLTSWMEGSEDNEHPAFRREDGTIIEGCECWWLPLEVALRLEDRAL